MFPKCRLAEVIEEALSDIGNMVELCGLILRPRNLAYPSIDPDLLLVRKITNLAGRGLNPFRHAGTRTHTLYSAVRLRVAGHCFCL